MNATILFYPNTIKANNSKGIIPIYMRIVYRRVKSEARLNTFILESELDKWDDATMQVLQRNHLANDFINKLNTKFKEFIFLNNTSLGSFTAKDIRNSILGITVSETQVQLIKYVNEYFENKGCTKRKLRTWYY